MSSDEYREKRGRRPTGSARSDVKAARRHMIRTYYRPKWEGENDSEVLEKLDRGRVVRLWGYLPVIIPFERHPSRKNIQIIEIILSRAI